MTAQHRRRQALWHRHGSGQRAQAVLEAGIVLPVMLFLIFAFIGLMLEVEGQEQLDAAVKLASESTFQAPYDPTSNRPLDRAGHSCCGGTGRSPLSTAGIPIECRYAAESFYGTMTYYSAFVSFHTGSLCNGGGPAAAVQCNLRAVDPAIPEPRVVKCTSQATLNLRKSPVGWAVFWDPTITSTAEAVPPPFRERNYPCPPPPLPKLPGCV